MHGAPDAHDASERLTAQVRDAHDTRTPLRVIGGGTWLDALRPCEGRALDVGEHRGVVEYTPGDLTLTARAGTTLDALRDLPAQHGQWIGLDPAARPGATLGATIATASDGPLATSLGRVRDIVLGLEYIDGTGERARCGGRVVKNVAGFDLVRLHTGAWGTLGVITEVTLRLRAMPAVDRTLVIAFDQRRALESVLAPLVDLPIAPLALELINGPLAGALGLAPADCLLVRVGGNATRVAGEESLLTALGNVEEAPDDVWERLQQLDPEHAIAARVSHMPTVISNTWRHVLEQCAQHQLWQPMLRASLSRGLVRLIIPNAASELPDGRSAHFVRILAPPGAHVSWERLPPHAWAQVPSPVADRLSVGIRDRLDPMRILNRGLLGEPHDAGVLAADAGVA
jgi:glycolate oxidase FAD binding subunit